MNPIKLSSLNQENIKILIISGFYFPSQLGGPSNSNYWLAEALQKQNHFVTVIATAAGIGKGMLNFNSWIYNSSGKVIYLKAFWNNFSIKTIFYFTKELNKHDIVQISSIFSMTSFIIAFICIISKKPFIWSPRGELSNSALKIKHIYKSSLLHIIKKFRSRIVFHITSTEELNALIFIFGNDIRSILIPNYIKIPEVRKVEKSNYFLYVGRLQPIKNLDLLILALNKSLLFRESNIKFLIVGDGGDNYKKTLLKLIDEKVLNEKILFLGQIDNTEVKNDIFAKAKFTFLVSKNENFGNVVLESISNGTPVVASKGTPWELLRVRMAGFWISSDIDKIANIIDDILTMNLDEYNEYCLNALSLSKEFNIDSKVFKWVTEYKKILNT